MSFDVEIEKIRSQFLKELNNVACIKEIENLKIRYLGKKGSVQGLLKQLKDCTNEERPRIGKLVNDLKQQILSHCENSHKRLVKEENVSKFLKEKIDVTQSGRRKWLGNKHILTQMTERMLNVFSSMGFAIELGPDIESDYYNFEGLNFPPDHPARDMQDTFYIGNEILLRTHTSNVQVRVMEKNNPPIRVVAPGTCFRNETVSARSHVIFHQIEGFYVDKNVSFADLLATLDEFWEKLFNEKIETRYRPSYFPFVEPGLEGDIRCTSCKGKGCHICKNSGWLEVIGAGMIHPEVLKSGGIDPEEYSGYAWGLGIDRLAMLEHNIDDIRIFLESDMRFLRQFP